MSQHLSKIRSGPHNILWKGFRNAEIIQIYVHSFIFSRPWLFW